MLVQQRNNQLSFKVNERQFSEEVLPEVKEETGIAASKSKLGGDFRLPCHTLGQSKKPSGKLGQLTDC